MRNVLLKLARDVRGASIVEFALVAPILIALLIGGMNIGIYLFAQNSVDNAVEAAARDAAIYPTPSDSDLKAIFADSLLKQEATIPVTLNVAHGSASNGTKYVSLSTSYNIPLNIVFGTVGSFPVKAERRVYVQN